MKMTEQAGKKKRHGRLILGIVIIVIVASFGMRFAALSGEKTIDSNATIHEREGRPVETVSAISGDITIWTTLAGTVEGIVQYPIISTNSIQVMDVLRKEGDWVKEGDIVIRLPEDLQYQLKGNTIFGSLYIPGGEKLKKVEYQSPNSEKIGKKLVIKISQVFGDIELIN